ncbi:MAG TPA: MFS transporter [Frankiaceae bacterium]|jgi:MFS family permease|nr:MFS transporter [Frankiaceae bacterium]
MAATAVVSPAESADGAALKERSLVPTLILVGLVVAVMSSLGAPLIPSISAASHVSLSAGEWLLTITLLTGALATPIMGRLADGPHQRRVILVALAIVLVGLILAATSSSFPVLVAARGLQGVGVGLMPVTMAVARRQLEPQKAASTIAILSVTAAVGVGLGYPITGLLAEISDYHASFWFGAVVVVAGLVISMIVLPGSSKMTSRRFDTVGASLLCIALAIFIVVLSEAETWGWLSPLVLGLLAASIVLAAAWARYELRRHDPLVDLRQARNRMVLTADIAGLIISLTMYLFLPIVVEFVQIPSSSGFGFGASVLVSGFVLVPLSIGTLGASRLAPLFERRYGRRIMIPLGAVLFAVAMGVFAIEHSGLWEAFLVMGIAGIGIGFTFAAMPGFIVKAVHAKDTGSAMGFYQVLRSIGLAMGSAISGVILAAYTRPHQAFPGVGGFRMALLIGAALCLFTALVTYFLPGRAPAAETHPVDTRELIDMEESAELAGAGLMLDGQDA